MDARKANLARVGLEEAREAVRYLRAAVKHLDEAGLTDAADGLAQTTAITAADLVIIKRAAQERFTCSCWADTVSWLEHQPSCPMRQG